MLIFIYGQNSYSALEKLGAMKAKFFATLDVSHMNYFEFPPAGKFIFELGEIMQAIQSPPFLAKKRMVVIKGLLAEFSTKVDAKPWMDVIQNIPESTIVIIFEDLTVKKTESHAIFKESQGKDDVHSYALENLSEYDLIKWADLYCKKIGLLIERDLLEKIVSLVGADQWQLASELNKLVAYMNGQKVDEKAINLLIHANSEEKIFELMDAIGSGQPALVMKCLENERNFGNPEGYLFAMLVRQIRLLLSAKDILEQNSQATNRDLAIKMGVHPYVAQKTLAQARNFELGSLIKLQNLMYELDKKIKRSEATERVAVDRVIAEMITVT